MNINTVEDRFYYYVWLFLEEINEKLLPDKKISSIVEIYININIKLKGYNNRLKKDKIIRFLVSKGVIKQVGKPIMAEIGRRTIPDYKVFEIYSFEVLPGFKRQHNYFRQLFAEESRETIYKFNGLTLDLSKGIIQFNQNNPIIISPSNKEIIFLTILLKNPGIIVKYRKLAKETDARFYRKNMDDKEFARNIQYIRRDLGKILKKAGMKSSQINKMIISTTNQGYKIVSS